MLFVFLLVCLIESQSAHPSVRVYGGRDANEKEFLYVVAIQTQVKFKIEINEIRTNYRFGCSGALLSSTWCLTAAHCLPPNFNVLLKTLPWQVRIVLTNRNLSKVSEITWGITHSSFKKINFLTKSMIYPHGDIALLRSEPMLLKEYARLSALEYTTLTGLEATSVGYGINQTTRKNDIDASNSNTTLRVLQTLVVRCPKRLINSMRALCISNTCAKSGAVCKGDSGSPLVHASGVIGVISLGYPTCKVPGKIEYDLLGFYKSFGGIIAGVAVPISPHIDWIVRKINENNTRSTFKINSVYSGVIKS